MVDVANQSCASDQGADVASARKEPSEPPDRRIIPRRCSNDLASLAPEIVFACVGYAILLAVGAAVFEVILFGVNVLTADGLVEALGAILAAILFSISVGIVWCGVATMFVMVFVWYFVRSLQLRPSWIRLGTFTGGLVGCIATIPFMGVVTEMSDRSEIAVLLFLGPGLTTMAGQLGGAWGVTVMKPRELVAPGLRQSERFQFGVRQMLVACVWVALLLTAIRLLGLDIVPVLLALCGWLIYQAALLRIGGHLAAWFRRWKAGRQTRST